MGAECSHYWKWGSWFWIFFWPEVAEEMLFRPGLFCGRVRAVVYVQGRGRYDHCKDEALGDGSVLDRPHLARHLMSEAVTGQILRKHNGYIIVGSELVSLAFPKRALCSSSADIPVSCSWKCGKTPESKVLARVQPILLAQVEDNWLRPELTPAESFLWFHCLVAWVHCRNKPGLCICTAKP